MNIFTGKIGTGTIIAAVGMAIYSTIDLCPVEGWIPWIRWIGSIIAILGGSTVAIGVTGKVDNVVKNQQALLPVINNIKALPTDCPQPLTEERFVELMRTVWKKVVATYPPPPKT